MSMNYPAEFPGIVPLEKMAFYLYQDTRTKDQQFFRCFIASLSDEVSIFKKDEWYAGKGNL